MWVHVTLSPSRPARFRNIDLFKWHFLGQTVTYVELDNNRVFFKIWMDATSNLTFFTQKLGTNVEKTRFKKKMFFPYFFPN